ncbi:hypothetical protein V6N13_020481 [Hibiscus sabdariffa]
MKRRGLKLAVLSHCSKTLAWSFNNGGSESPRVLCPKSIREYSLHVYGRAAGGNAKRATKYPHSLSFLHFVCSVPRNAIAFLLPWMFSLV